MLALVIFLDRLFGFLVSKKLWLNVKGGLSAGRVQSPAVKILVDREKLRSNFKQNEFWDLQGEFKFKEDTIIKDVQVDSAVSPPCPPPVGIENNTNNLSLKIIGTFDILGKKKKANSKDLNIIRYENGLVEKKYIVK